MQSLESSTPIAARSHETILNEATREHEREFGHSDNIVYEEGQADPEPSFWYKPVIHQWIEGGKLYRNPERRSIGQFELFLDLVLVGVVHQLADVAAETTSGASVLRFILTFWPTWSIVADYRGFINASGVDDVVQRMYSLFTMALIIGFSINAAAVELPTVPEDWVIPNHAARAALAFYLVAKCTSAGFLLVYAAALPKFRLHLLANFARVAVTVALVAAATAIATLETVAILLTFCAFWEAFSIYFVGFLVMLQKHAQKWSPNRRNVKIVHSAAVAINIEHYVERSAAFVSIVLGEAVANIIFNAADYSGAIGITVFYGRAICVLITAFAINWIYFTGEYSVVRTHALRRHWLSSSLYTTIHWPLCAALILASAAVARMVTSNSVNVSLRYYWGGGIAVALTCISLLEHLHKINEWDRTISIAYTTRIATRVVGGIIFASTPLATWLPDIALLGIDASVMVAIVLEESFGKSAIIKARTRTRSRDEETSELENGSPFTRRSIPQNQESDRDMKRPEDKDPEIT